MMADVRLASVQILVGDPAASWERLGFVVGADGVALEGVTVVPVGEGELSVAVPDLAMSGADGLALRAADTPRVAAAAHPNGAFAVDHVVALTDSLTRTVDALVAAGLDPRRTSPPMAFLRMGPCILEVVERAGVEAPFLWGLVVVTPELPASEWVGEPRDAVQPGRRIATVRGETGLSCALAFMTPRPQPAAAG
jgi:hypothetical protein